MFRTYHRKESTNGSEVERFERPNTATCLVLKSGNYDTVDEDGMVTPGQRLSTGDCIIGQTMQMQEVGENGKQSVKRDRSLFLRTHETETVDTVMRAKTTDGHNQVKVKTRTTRVPQVGDKLSSRHGQKGVIGLVAPPEDMPFAADGRRPDLIVNSHAFPSRMTMGHLVECLAGQLASRQGVQADGTMFRDVTIDRLGDALAELGLARDGKTVMMDGTTGEMLESRVYLGMTHYQRLRHMVYDKRQARGRGGYQLISHQPVEGGKVGGGLRFGEMERDTLISHGAPYIMLDRMLEQSDAYVAPVCRVCGLLAQHECASKALTHRARQALCRSCGSTDIVKQVMPYPAKLLFQELQVLGISSRLQFDEVVAPTGPAAVHVRA